MLCIGLSEKQVGNLRSPVEDWTVGGTVLTSLMDVKRRHEGDYELLQEINIAVPLPKLPSRLGEQKIQAA